MWVLIIIMLILGNKRGRNKGAALQLSTGNSIERQNNSIFSGFLLLFVKFFFLWFLLRLLKAGFCCVKECKKVKKKCL